MRIKSRCYLLVPVAFTILIYRTHTIMLHAHEPSATCCKLNSVARGFTYGFTVRLMHFTKKCCDRTVPPFNLERTWIHAGHTACRLRLGAFNAEDGGHALWLHDHTVGVCS